jgi:hypothetical protein
MTIRLRANAEILRQRILAARTALFDVENALPSGDTRRRVYAMRSELGNMINALGLEQPGDSEE